MLRVLRSFIVASLLFAGLTLGATPVQASATTCQTRDVTWVYTDPNTQSVYSIKFRIRACFDDSSAWGTSATYQTSCCGIDTYLSPYWTGNFTSLARVHSWLHYKDFFGIGRYDNFRASITDGGTWSCGDDGGSFGALAYCRITNPL